MSDLGGLLILGAFFGAPVVLVGWAIHQNHKAVAREREALDALRARHPDWRPAPLTQGSRPSHQAWVLSGRTPAGLAWELGRRSRARRKNGPSALDELVLRIPELATGRLELALGSALDPQVADQAMAALQAAESSFLGRAVLGFLGNQLQGSGFELKEFLDFLEEARRHPYSWRDPRWNERMPVQTRGGVVLDDVLDETLEGLLRVCPDIPGDSKKPPLYILWGSEGLRITRPLAHGPAAALVEQVVAVGEYLGDRLHAQHSATRALAGDRF